MAEELAGPKFHSYNLTVETKVNLDPLIYIYTPMDLPLQTGVGADGLVILPNLPVDNRLFSWLEEDVPTPRGTLNEDLDNSETGVDVVTGHAVRFLVGDVIRIDDEYMSITAIDTGTEVLTVVRGALSSSAVVHSNQAEIVGIGTVLAEGEIGTSNFQGRDKVDNYTQIFSRKLEVTGTEQIIPKYGVPNELNKQVMNVTHGLLVAVEQAAVYGKKFEDSTTQTRSTGGLMAFITSHNNTADDWLTVLNMDEVQQDVYDDGGMFDVLMSRPRNFGALSNIVGAERIQTVNIDDVRRGRRRAQVVMTDHGDVTLVRNRYMRGADAVAYTREAFVKRVMRPLHMSALAKTKDTDSFMILTELGFEIKGQRHMAKWTSLDSSSSFPTELV